jgi:hypothetical protein
MSGPPEKQGKGATSNIEDLMLSQFRPPNPARKAGVVSLPPVKSRA